MITSSIRLIWGSRGLALKASENMVASFNVNNRNQREDSQKQKYRREWDSHIDEIFVWDFEGNIMKFGNEMKAWVSYVFIGGLRREEG